MRRSTCCAECDPKCRVACIGAGGENLVLIAGVALDGRDTRMAGRGGMGAVMGSKNLKAIAVRGTQKIVYHDRGTFLKYVQSVNNPLKDNNYIISLYKFGTAGGVAFTERTGDLPIKNWSEGNWAAGAQKIQGQTIRETIYTHTTRCFACPIACTQHVEIKEGEHAGLKSHGAEYETLALLGANCLNDDLESITKANDLCNRYGLDTISTGSTIAFAMEAFERGILTPEMCDGIDLRWGNGKAVVQCVEALAHRRGFLGNLLADGTRKAASGWATARPNLRCTSKAWKCPRTIRARSSRWRRITRRARAARATWNRSATGRSWASRSRNWAIKAASTLTPMRAKPRSPTICRTSCR